jgi:hypothetical protein
MADSFGALSRGSKIAEHVSTLKGLAWADRTKLRSEASNEPNVGPLSHNPADYIVCKAYRATSRRLYTPTDF